MPVGSVGFRRAPSEVLLGALGGAADALVVPRVAVLGEGLRRPLAHLPPGEVARRVPEPQPAVVREESGRKALEGLQPAGRVALVGDPVEAGEDVGPCSPAAGRADVVVLELVDERSAPLRGQRSEHAGERAGQRRGSASESAGSGPGAGAWG